MQKCLIGTAVNAFTIPDVPWPSEPGWMGIYAWPYAFSSGHSRNQPNLDPRQARSNHQSTTKTTLTGCCRWPERIAVHQTLQASME